MRSLPRAQGLHRKCGVFGLSKWEHAVAGHSFMWVRSLPRAQGLHCKRGVFEPVAVGVYGAQARLQVEGAPAQDSGSPLQMRCFWAYYGRSMRGLGTALARRSSCSPFRFFIANAVFLSLLWWEHTCCKRLLRW